MLHVNAIVLATLAAALFANAVVLGIMAKHDAHRAGTVAAVGRRSVGARRARAFGPWHTSLSTALYVQLGALVVLSIARAAGC